MKKIKTIYADAENKILSDVHTQLDSQSAVKEKELDTFWCMTAYETRETLNSFLFIIQEDIKEQLKREKIAMKRKKRPRG